MINALRDAVWEAKARHLTELSLASSKDLWCTEPWAFELMDEFAQGQRGSLPLNVVPPGMWIQRGYL
jgi:hypothetical protein